ncbi:hypothetical protein FRB98_005359 [Tulasnella sp. 332]|nr:hypothetical protein FRB98_005359 [Tulasnella sp. 332]
MAAIYTIFSSPTHPPVPNHLPTLIVTPHGQPSNVLYSYLHTNFNTENYLLTPSPQGDLCVAKLFPPSRKPSAKPGASASDPGHSGSAAPVVRCEASRSLKWTIQNTGVISPIYKLSLPSPDSQDLPLFQISKPNPNATFWSMFYFTYAGHLIPPKRIEFGKIQKNPAGPGGGGTRISISGKTPEEKSVWQTLGEGNEDCVEWVVLCAALNLLDDEILKAAGSSAGGGSSTSLNRVESSSSRTKPVPLPVTNGGGPPRPAPPPGPPAPTPNAGRGQQPPPPGPGYRGPPGPPGPQGGSQMPMMRGGPPPGPNQNQPNPDPRWQPSQPQQNGGQGAGYRGPPPPPPQGAAGPPYDPRSQPPPRFDGRGPPPGPDPRGPPPGPSPSNPQARPPPNHLRKGPPPQNGQPQRRF